MKYSLLIFITLLAAICAPGLGALTADQPFMPRDQVMARFTSLTEAARMGDFDAYRAHFDQERFMGMNADATLWPTYQSFEALAKPNFSAIKETLDLSFPEVSILIVDDNTAILTNRYVHKLKLQDGTAIESAGAGTQVWSRRTGTWLLVSVSAAAR